jgi:hypothetical protein
MIFRISIINSTRSTFLSTLKTIMDDIALLEFPLFKNKSSLGYCNLASYFSYFIFKPAAINEEKSGCGCNSLDLNSG